jgi:Domain of unknown function (DUF4129)
VTWRRLLPLALTVLALLVLVAVAAHGRPLGTGGPRSKGLPLTFWDYVFTTLVILELLLVVFALVMLLLFRRERVEIASYNRRTFRSLAILLVMATLLTFLGRHIDLQHLFHPHASTTTTATSGGSGTGKLRGSAGRQHLQFAWGELVVVLVLLLALGAWAYFTRRRLLAAVPRRISRTVLAAALDESLDDLRADDDLRRAIVAAYARMEDALASAGLPRHPAEAPFEYVERALLDLDASAADVRRLTDLFEWARFSDHEPEPWMRDEAVDALVAVRDELRVSERIAT